MIVFGCALIPLIPVALLLVKAIRGVNASRALVAAALLELLLAIYVATQRKPGSSVYFLSNYGVLDASSLLFLMVISIVFFGITLYIHHRLTAGLMPQAIETFIVRVSLFFTSCILAVISNHLVVMWVFLELGTLALAPLIYYARDIEAVHASWKYLIFSVIGLGCNLLGLMCIARAMGGAVGHDSASHLTLFMNELQEVHSLGEQRWWELGLALMVFGLGTKLGLAPVYSWLPDAYDLSPPSITALMASVQFNCVILCLFREVGLLRSFDQTLVSDELLIMGVLSVAVAALKIVAVDNYKRLIAYASINHAGTIAIGLGIGKNAGYGVVLYVVSNAFVKAVLFLACGNIKAHFGTKKISALRGLIRVMPFSGWAFMLGVFALLGFAPFGSFIGEVIMLSAVVDSGYLWVFFTICIILTIILIASGRALFPMIWGESIDEGPIKDEPLLSNAASMLFIVILVSLGIYSPTFVTSLIQEVAVTLGSP